MESKEKNEVDIEKDKRLLDVLKPENKYEETNKAAKINTLNSNELAIYILKTSKILLEKYFSESPCYENEKLFKELAQKELVKGKESRAFNLNLFDEPLEFYNDLKNYFDFGLEYLCFPSKTKVDRMKRLIQSNFSVYYFSILLDVLIEILERDPSAHKDDIIKFDITMICEFFRQKNERLFSNHSFFHCCVNELMKKYKVTLPGNNAFRKKYLELCRKKSSDTLQKVKNNLCDYILTNLDNYCQIIYKEWKTKNIYIQNEDDEEECKKIHDKYIKMEKLISSDKDNYFNSEQDLKEWCEKTEISEYLNEYAEYLTQKKYFVNQSDKVEWKKHVYENCLLPSGILSIDEENEENIYVISSIDYDDKINYSEESYDGQTFFEQYKMAKEELNYLNQKCYKDEIEFLINEDSFLEEFFSVLQSKSVSNYLKSVIKFDNDNENDFTVKLNEIPQKEGKIDIDSLFEKESKGDLYLGEQYDAFIKDMKADYTSFRKLIIIKELGYKLPACTGPSMRIFINPRLQFSKVAKENDFQRKNLLKSAIIILLVHEITHVLKYYPLKSKYPEKTPQTPKNKENGKCLMFYLFKKAIIDKINYGQSSEINNVYNWNNLGKLNKIFEKTNDPNSNKGSGEKEGELDLYSTISKNVRLKKNGKRKIKTDYCWWL